MMLVVVSLHVLTATDAFVLYNLGLPNEFVLAKSDGGDWFDTAHISRNPYCKRKYFCSHFFFFFFFFFFLLKSCFHMPMALRKMHKDKVQCENVYVYSKHVILL